MSKEPALWRLLIAEASTEMLIYRDGRVRVPASELVRPLRRALSTLWTDSTEDALLSALLCAAELECALCDDSHDADAASSLTDRFASLACTANPRSAFSLETCQKLLGSIRYGGELTVSRPEGFAYYALHPLDFADLVSAAGLKAQCSHVIGIRSIGTTLSAVVAAALNSNGISSSRTTVRPEGHPYDRQTTFTAAQRNAIKQAASQGAVFLVCDEGPGRSGSSLLCVAEALEREAVSPSRIVLLCSHQPNVDVLCSSNAPQRWRRYRSVAVGMTKRLPHQSGEYLGEDEWRRLFVGDSSEWPALWPNTERLKFLARDRQRLLKFQGHGPYGEAVREREQMLAANGFGARYLGREAGFGIQELVRGIKISIASPSLALLNYVAKYCAWRAEAFGATVTQDAIRQLEEMAAHNLEQEFGFAPELRLEAERPAICDGRMQPYTWREVGNARWIKLDASTHGDDHFFPGPTDIAWDLAAVCVDWQLNADYREFFLSAYQRLSGDNPAGRLHQYEIAYAAFRLGWSRMAAASVSDSDEKGRLLRDAVRYRSVLGRMLAANAVTR